MDLPPTGGLGITGPGAESAARAALVAALAALASGGPADPDSRGIVVIPAATLTTLLGVDAVALHPWPRLQVADSLDHALHLLEQHALYRSRVLDDHNVTTIDALRDTDPNEEPLPPVLLVTDTPPAGLQMRTRAVLGLGHRLDITAVLLGDWPHGPTVHVDTDGTCHPTTQTDTDQIDAGRTDPDDAAGERPTRIAVLDTTATIDLLHTLREATTGEPHPPAADATTTHGRQPPSATLPYPTPVDSPADSEPEPDSPAMSGNVAHHTPAGTSQRGAVPRPSTDRRQRPARVRVLGRPTVDHPDGSQPPAMRSKAVELLVYLAVHPDGATSDQIVNDLFPDARMKHAHTRLHTAVYNLRQILAHAAGDSDGEHVLRTNRTYQLDPSTVDVDLWRFHTAIDHAARADDTTTRTAHLRAACDTITGGLADGCDYDDWIETHREATRRHIIDVHATLADTLLDTEPWAAAELLQKAIAHDRYNEALHQQLMHVWHRLGDPDAIRATLRRLTRALDDIDAEPTDTTTNLAAALRHDLDHRQPPHPRQHDRA